MKEIIHTINSMNRTVHNDLYKNFDEAKKYRVAIDALIEGLVKYEENKRSSNLAAYVNYFIVKAFEKEFGIEVDDSFLDN